MLDEANLENLLVRVVDRLRRESIMPGKKYLNEREVAQIIGVKVPTLHAWRGKRSPQGPPWVKLGKMVRYPVADLEAHLGKFIRK